MKALTERERNVILAALDLADNTWQADAASEEDQEYAQDKLALGAVYDWLLERQPPLVTILFAWSHDHGYCYECGLPAAFVLPDVYGPNSGLITASMKRCAVCAANGAVDGERVVRIEEP